MLAVTKLVGQHDLVGAGQHLTRVGAAAGQDADRVPGRGGHRGRLLPHAADVPDREAPAVRGAVDVVEVAADVLVLGGGQVRRRDLHTGDVGPAPGHQAGVQRVDRVGAAPEHPVDPDGQRHLLAEILHQGQVSHLEVAVRGAPGQGQHT
jgi:hypothetical protein